MTSEEMGELLKPLADNKLVAALLDALVPFYPALQRMATDLLQRVLQAWEQKDWPAVAENLARASKKDELIDFNFRAAMLYQTLRAKEIEYGKAAMDVGLRVAIALLVTAM